MLFLKMQPNVPFTSSIVEMVKSAIGRQCSKRHVPKYVFETPEIPVCSKSPSCVFKHGLTPLITCACITDHVISRRM